MLAIEPPDLEIRDEELLAAEAISRTVGALTVERIDGFIEILQNLRTRVADGADVPVCPELTNANPSAPHVVILETQAWLLAQMAYRINQVPEQNLAEFAALFGTGRREATHAETILRFTIADGTVSPVVVPRGTIVLDQTETVRFETTEDLTIQIGQFSADVSAKRNIAGYTLLAPGTLTKIGGSLVGVNSVRNPFAVESGTDEETLDAALDRMRQYQRRTERIVTAKDLEDALREEVGGVVKVFPFVVNGEFGTEPTAGHTTVILATHNGDAVDPAQLAKATKLLEQIVGNQFVYIASPFFADFSISARVKVAEFAVASSVKAHVETRLREFYKTRAESFGKPILRSEIIAVIEAADGVERIMSAPDAPILQSPLADRRLPVWAMPRLREVSIDVA